MYLARSKRPKTAAQVVRALSDYAFRGQYHFLPLVQDWILKTLAEDYTDYAKRDISKLAKAAAGVVGLRGEAIAAKALRRIHWVRSYKETWRSVSPWDRRAIIAAGAVLSPDERSHWKKTILASDDPLDRGCGRLVPVNEPTRTRITNPLPFQRTAIQVLNEREPGALKRHSMDPNAWRRIIPIHLRSQREERPLSRNLCIAGSGPELMLSFASGTTIRSIGLRQCAAAAEVSESP